MQRALWLWHEKQDTIPLLEFQFICTEKWKMIEFEVFFRQNFMPDFLEFCIKKHAISHDKIIITV